MWTLLLLLQRTNSPAHATTRLQAQKQNSQTHKQPFRNLQGKGRSCGGERQGGLRFGIFVAPSVPSGCITLQDHPQAPHGLTCSVEGLAAHLPVHKQPEGDTPTAREARCGAVHQQLALVERHHRPPVKLALDVGELREARSPHRDQSPPKLVPIVGGESGGNRTSIGHCKKEEQCDNEWGAHTTGLEITVGHCSFSNQIAQQMPFC